MNRMLRNKLKACLLLAALAFSTVPASYADGTEGLGAPSIAIAEGTGVATGGVGLVGKAGSVPIIVDVPLGVSVKQVLLYWTSDVAGQPDANQFGINGTVITGTTIGGPTPFIEFPAASYRADITAMNLIGPGPNTVFATQWRATGAGILVIYDDGTATSVTLRDGQDITYEPFDEPLKTTVPQTYTFPASSASRNVQISILAAGLISGSLPNALLVTVGGVTTTYENFFFESDGDWFDSATLDVTIPAGVTSVTIQALSRPATATDPFAGKLALIAAAVTVPDEEITFNGCTFTWGYWKNHSTFGNASHKRDAGWDNLPQSENTPFFLSGGTYATIMQTAVKGNPYYALAHQYAAAHLNLLSGAPQDASILDPFNAATALFQTYTPAQVGDKKNKALQEQFKALIAPLDIYNNGGGVAGHCDKIADADNAGLRAAKETTSGLETAFPNPFRAETSIRFSLATDSRVKLAVYDLLGREVAVLAQGSLAAGSHRATFAGDNLPSGVYLYRLETEDGVFTKRVVLAK